MSPRTRLALTAALAVAVACSDGTRPLDPGTADALRLTPTALVFGDVALGSTKALSALASGATVTVVPGDPLDDAFTFAVTTAPTGTTIAVTYAPTTAGTHVGTLLVRVDGVTRATLTLEGRGVGPTVTVSPSVLRFVDVPAGGRAALTLTVTNGPTAVELAFELGVNVERCANASGAPFCLMPSSRPFDDIDRVALAPNEVATFEVRYFPVAAGVQSRATLSVRTCAGCPAIPVTIEGVAAPADFVCGPSSLTFGPASRGSCSGAQIVTCTNSTAEARQILRVASSNPDFVVRGLSLPQAVPAGLAQALEVDFCPSRPGEHTGTIDIETDDARRFRVDLVGGRRDPDIDVQPAMLELPPTALIAPSQRSITIRNVGDAPLDVTGADLGLGASSPFSVQLAGRSIPPGDAIEVVIEFQPRVVGPAFDLLRITSDDPDEAQVTVGLRGEGVDVPPCSYRVAPAALDFGAVERGRFVRRAIEVRNVGMGDCLLTGVQQRSGAPEIVLLGGDRGARIAPGAAEVIEVEFAPERLGTHARSLVLGLSDPRAPFVQVPITGEGTDATLLVAPREMELGHAPTGCGLRAQELRLHAGASPLVVSSVGIDDSDGTFSVEFPPALPLTLAPFTSTRMDVRFHGGVASQRAGTVRIVGSQGNAATTWYAGLRASTGPAQRVTDSFEQAAAPVADVLVILDNSCSMGEELMGFRQNLAAFLRAATDFGADYRVAITTTDPDAEAGRFLPNFVDPSTRVVTAATAPAPAAQLASNMSSTLATTGSGLESGLVAALQALSSPLSFEHNGGFLRREASLSVIVLSDEDDSSPGTAQLYVDLLRSIKGAHHPRGPAAMLAVVGDALQGCDGVGGAAAAGNRYIDLVRATSGTFQSICTGDWQRVMSDLGSRAFGPRQVFELKMQPIVASIQVRVDGMPVPEVGAGGQVLWRYDFSSNSVMFSPLQVPGAGAQIDLSYQPECF